MFLHITKSKSLNSCFERRSKLQKKNDNLLDKFVKKNYNNELEKVLEKKYFAENTKSGAESNAQHRIKHLANNTMGPILYSRCCKNTAIRPRCNCKTAVFNGTNTRHGFVWHFVLKNRGRTACVSMFFILYHRSKTVTITYLEQKKTRSITQNRHGRSIQKS